MFKPCCLYGNTIVERAPSGPLRRPWQRRPPEAGWTQLLPVKQAGVVGQEGPLREASQFQSETQMCALLALKKEKIESPAWNLRLPFPNSLVG